MINIVFLGPPGAGKGTQSAKLVEDFNIVQISTGDILRNAVKTGSELGKLAKKYMDEGKLVPDDVIIGIVKARLQQDDCKNGFILDGFPRTIPQAEALDEMLKNDLNIELTHIISLNVPDELILERLTGRRSCPQCGAAYHIKYNPPKEDNKCDLCGADLIQRDDDKEETINKRLKVYHEQTEQLKEYYSKTNKFYEIDGTLNPDEVYRKIKELLQ
ncbi:adenylate kinase [Deferribacter desulfuricans SSM1]|uniref:Adenylate kinase n=1 Tax=Deferribacter desulfuricans (strain DSM 14783 / JCM 11476 / NBRC 101012 / SSM1) TaxID=639282 RepID=D3P917_DEFDS|nr:adenylate kinase [Deferribacter desulfuricans]BAI81207.1 adenylate kinase [Deferribacter desulfuricans SSM1]